jgi:hypothetical protein
MINTIPPRYMRPRDMAQLYGITTKALYELLWSGEIRGVAIGGRALVDCESAASFFATLPNEFMTPSSVKEAKHKKKKIQQWLRERASVANRAGDEYALGLSDET